MSDVTRILLSIITIMLLLTTLGCQGPQTTELDDEYARPLPYGKIGLRKITDTSRLPDMNMIALQLGVDDWRSALQHSIDWFSKPSSNQFYPMGPISHAQAWASLYALQQLDWRQPKKAISQLTEQFDVWESVGWNDQGEVYYTGYFTPVYKASPLRTGEYQYPLYKKPSDLVSDPISGKVLGQRRVGGGLILYPTRAEIMDGNLLGGYELVWLANKLDAYLIHVNGSAKLLLNTGGIMYIGYAGSNGRNYTSLGKMLVQDGKLDKNKLNLTAIRKYFKNHPNDLDHYIRRNQRFVFFAEYDGSQWPAGSMGFQVTPQRTIATDKSVFPRGCVTWVQTTITDRITTRQSRFNQLMLDQDTGGAIRAAGRADIYFGIGQNAEQLAGMQQTTGQLYYILLKPQYVNHWYYLINTSEQSLQNLPKQVN